MKRLVCSFCGKLMHVIFDTETKEVWWCKECGTMFNHTKGTPKDFMRIPWIVTRVALRK